MPPLYQSTPVPDQNHMPSPIRSLLEAHICLEATRDYLERRTRGHKPLCECPLCLAAQAAREAADWTRCAAHEAMSS